MKQLSVLFLIVSFSLVACSQSSKGVAKPAAIVNNSDNGIKEITDYVAGKGYENYFHFEHDNVKKIEVNNQSTTAKKLSRTLLP